MQCSGFGPPRAEHRGGEPFSPCWPCSVPCTPWFHWPSWPQGHIAASCQPGLNRWPTIGQPRLHWPSWPPGNTTALWSTVGLLGHQETHCCPTVSLWSTIGQPGHNRPSCPQGNTTALWSTVGQPFTSENTVGLLGHQDTLLPHGQPVVNRWPTIGQPRLYWPS